MSSDLKVVASEKKQNSASKKVAGNGTTTEEHNTHAELEDTYLGGDYSSATIKKLRASPESISKFFKEGKYPYTDKIPRDKYEEENKKLQIELLKVQNWVKMTGQKIVVIF